MTGLELIAETRKEPSFLKYLLLASVVLMAHPGFVWSAGEGGAPGKNPSDSLTPAQWQTIDHSVDAGLKYIIKNQMPDGSFKAPRSGQPGITSLCIMSFLSRGYTPDEGPYARNLTSAIEYVLSHQQSNGIISTGGSRPNYSHAISGLMLGEVYGQTNGSLNTRLKPALEKALEYSRMRQTMRKRRKEDRGGWRYHRRYGPTDSDLTATTWNLMFYRSAKNAGFEGPSEYVEDAMGYIKRSFAPELGAFVYTNKRSWREEYYVSGATAAGGIVSLAMAGEHQNPLALKAGDWILQHPFNQYNYRPHRSDDRYHYSGYYCSQAMFLLGGQHWERFFPPYLDTISKNQNPDGSWDRERVHDGGFGNVYTTALMVLSLTPPYQILPIYQR